MHASLNRREFLKTLGLATAAVTLPACRSTPGISATDSRKRPPNFVIIFIDDMGYADVGCFGAQGNETPNIDRMAAEGTRFTDFYAASSVCTPSRAALMTGCYPQRVGLPNVLGPNARIGLSDGETTIAQTLKGTPNAKQGVGDPEPLGYATACYGKWHLGHLPQFLPTHHGFDEYFGLPYSNDMWPRHPETPKAYPDLPLVEGDRVVAYDPDQTQLTTWYTERAVRFIEKNQDRPFFLYVPHSMVHVPLHVSDKFKGKSKRGLFGDVVMEIDWSVGQILDTLRRLGLDKDTMVLFCSDNGPWLSYGEHAGSAQPLREGKATTFDGGQREPTIFWQPGHIPAGQVCREPATTMDLLPTIAGRAGAKLPDHKIDGKDIWPLVSGQPGAKSPHEAFFYYNSWALQAVRSGKWKLHFPHAYNTLAGRPGGKDGVPAKYEQARIDLALFDLETDISEQHNVADQHPDVVKRLQQLADAMRQDLGDGKQEGSGRRPPGKTGAEK